MFDDRLEGALGDFDALLHLTGDNQAEEKRIGCRKLRLAAAWADAHGAAEDRDAADDGPSGVLVERFVRMGAVGTPLVAETCPAEWALPQHTSPAGARAIIADALTLRHRHPRLWQQILAGKVFAWKARQVGQRCSGLNVLSARIVDRLVTDQLELMAWTRFEKILDATLLQVDETTYQQRAAQAAAQRDVCATQSSAGLRTLIARVTAGDATMFLALVNRVADCLAEDGDEDPIGMRRSKAIGIVAHPGRLLDLLTRHVGDTDPHRTPDQQVSDHLGDPTDPWAADPPPAGWDTDRHGAYHQPRCPHDPDHPDSGGWDAQTPAGGDGEPWTDEPPINDTDRDWYHRHTDGDDGKRDQAGHADDNNGDRVGGVAGDRHPVDGDSDRAGPAGDGSAEKTANTDLSNCSTEPDPVDEHRAVVPPAFGGTRFPARRLTPTELAACRPTAVVHLHLSDQTIRDRRGVVRTEHGPISLDQLRPLLTDTDADADIKVYPVVDRADTAPVDGYEIPLSLRRAINIRNPGSVWPYSPATTISPGGHLDLDHTMPYRTTGPPGQTSTNNLGPLTRTEHRAKTLGGWTARQPEPGTYLWRTPQGWIAITTNQGTLLLGHTPWAHQLWQTARPNESEPALS